MLVVLHVAESGTSVLPAILGRSGALPVTNAQEGEAIEAGRVYVAPHSHHLVVAAGTLRLLDGPRENGHRPAVDPLFRAVAAAYGPRAVGGVLSGSGDDGTAGLREIKRRGGVTIVQDPEESPFPSMPRHAMTHVAVDAVLRLHDIGFALARLVRDLAGAHDARPERADGGEAIAGGQRAAEGCERRARGAADQAAAIRTPLRRVFTGWRPDEDEPTAAIGGTGA